MPAGPLDTSLPQPPVMEAGEAGPPGRMASSKLPKGASGTMMPIQGFAGAPGEATTGKFTLLCNVLCVSPFILFHSFPSSEID